MRTETTALRVRVLTMPRLVRYSRWPPEAFGYRRIGCKRRIMFTRS